MKELVLLRYMHRAIANYLFYRRGEFSSEEEIKRYQFAKLKQLVQYSWEHIPFYRSYWSESGFSPDNFKGLEDVRRIPYLTKDIVREHSEQMLSTFARPNRLKVYKTGGTSGMPLHFYLDQRIVIPREAAALYNLFRSFNYKPYAPCVFLEGAILEEARINKGIFWKRNLLRNGLVMSSFHLNVDTVVAYVNRIKKFHPRYIFGYPSSTTILCRLMKQKGLAPIGSLKYVVCSSENVYQWQRDLVEEVLGVKIFSQYGLSEKCVIAGNCDHSSNLHFSPYYGYVELINSEGKVCTEEGEEGEIVATGFDHEDFAFIRYKTSDRAELTNQECDCGRKHFSVKRIIGREQDFVVNLNGDLNPFTCSDEIFWTLPNKIIAYQYVQNEKGKLELKIEVKETLRGEEIRIIQKRFQERFIGFTVKLVEVDQIPRTKSGKFKYLQQNLKLTHN